MMESDSDGMTCNGNHYQGGSRYTKADRDKTIRAAWRAEVQEARRNATIHKATSSVMKADRLVREIRQDIVNRHAERNAEQARAITNGWFRK